jgi:SAM-dependent methyltransferase
MNFLDAARTYERYKHASVSQVIADDDVMFNTGKDWYFYVGESALNSILSALTLSRLEAVTSVLDLPCGHGRVSRHLRAAFPEAEFAFCDIDPAGVDFCVTNFNGRGIRSKPEVTGVDLGGHFDVIWVGSLFTHVDRRRTERWLRYFCQHLSNDGVLIASFHGTWAREVHLKHYPMIGGREWSKIEKECAKTGFGYRPYPNQDYGISLSRASAIVDMSCAIPGARLLSYTERGWAEHHDVVAIARTDRLQDWQSAANRYP